MPKSALLIVTTAASVLSFAIGIAATIWRR
jgi:hypothetical protein